MEHSAQLGLRLSVCILIGVVTSSSAQAPYDDLEVTLAPAAREYCHIVRFPRPWAIQRLDDRTGEPLFFGAEYSDFEFRVEGLLSTQFLVAGFTESVGKNFYTAERYKVDLSDPTTPVVTASRTAWDAASVVPLTQRSTFLYSEPSREQSAEFQGFKFTKTGDLWAAPFEYATRLSPDQAWLVLQSATQQTEYGAARVFFDFFNTATGKKLFTIEGAFCSPIGDDAYNSLGKSGWVTERYFVVPLGKQIERCLVCDFGGRTRVR